MNGRNYVLIAMISFFVIGLVLILGSALIVDFPTAFMMILFGMLMLASGMICLIDLLMNPCYSTQQTFQKVDEK